MVTKKIIAIIPARAGSKRIPGKNTRLFHGKPMLAWTIEAALSSGVFDKVIVSTDSEEIAAIAKQYGASVPFLRDAYTDDFSTVSEVTYYVLGQMKEKLHETYDIVVQLMPNCPLRNAHDIKNSLHYFIQQKHNFQISCFKFGWNNPWWAFTKDQQSRPTPLFPDSMKKRSQDLPELYCPTGAIWIAHAQKFLESKTFYGKNYRCYDISWQSAIDIDTLEDWQMAEALYRANLFSFEPCQSTPDHAQLIMTWRNDPHTLEMSFHSEPKQWPAFLTEYQQHYFANPSFPPMFAILNNQKIGFVRLENIKENQEANVSINIAPEMRNKGLGTAILNHYIDYLKINTSIKSIIAEIKKSNVASLKAFKKASFVEIESIKKYVEDINQSFDVIRLKRSV